MYMYNSGLNLTIPISSLHTVQFNDNKFPLLLSVGVMTQLFSLQTVVLVNSDIHISFKLGSWSPLV